MTKTEEVREWRKAFLGKAMLFVNGMILGALPGAMFGGRRDLVLWGVALGVVWMLTGAIRWGMALSEEEVSE